MIQKEYGKFLISCDLCDQVCLDAFDTFQDAVDNRRDQGYKISKDTTGNWFDLCENCQNKKEN